MILCIDNFDSFTFNLVQAVPDIAMTVVRNNDPFLIDFANHPHMDAILISPGPGRPSQTGYVEDVIARYHKQTPILGVCLGHQTLATFFGGTVDHAPQLMHGKTSWVYHDNSLLFNGLPSPFEAARYHSLHVPRNTLPDCFAVTAATQDNCVMAIQHHSDPLFGIQFHPESILTPQGSTILRNFFTFARQH